MALGTGNQLYIGTVDNHIWVASLNVDLTSPLKGAVAKSVIQVSDRWKHKQRANWLADTDVFPLPENVFVLQRRELRQPRDSDKNVSALHI